MRKINIQKVMDTRNLDFNETAHHLFPHNMHPVPALKRVVSGEAVLDANQISKLSNLSGLTATELFEDGWKSELKKTKVVFTTCRYRAELCRRTWVTRVSHKESLFHEEVISTGAIAVTEYLNKLDEIIKNYEENE